MKNTSIHSIVLLTLCGFILYQSIINQGSIRQARLLSHSMAAQLDSLQLITAQYERIHRSYEDLHIQLLLSRHHVSDVSRELSRISTEQQADVSQIRDRLQEILSTYDTLQPPSIMSHYEIPIQP